MKIIAFYNGKYPDGFSPMMLRLHYYMKALQSYKNEVEIVMPSSIENTQNGIFENIPYSFVYIPQTTKFNKLFVKKYYVEHCKKLAYSCDSLLLVGINHLFLPDIAEAVHKTGAKIVIEQNENPGVIKASRLDTTLSLKIERYFWFHKCLPKLDGLIVISHALEEMIAKYKHPSTKITRIPILSGNNKISPPHKPTPNDGIPYILHAGALSEQKDGIISMIEAFAIAHKRLNGKLKFILTYDIGFPKLKRKINKIIKKNNLENSIRFTGILSKKDLSELRDNCALSIINKPSNAQNDYNFPTKLSELLPLRIPIIVSNTGEMSRYFINGENAFVVEANNANMIADKIVYIIQNPEAVNNITERGQLLAIKEFYYMNYAKKLNSFFNSLV